MFKNLKSLALMSAVAVITMAGCESAQRTESTPTTTHNSSDLYFPPRYTAPAPKPAPAPVMKAAAPAPAPAPRMGTCGGTLFYPTGSRETSALMVEKMIPCEIVSGQCVDYFIKVTNLTAMALENVTVTDRISSNFNVKSAEPMGSPAGDQMAWNLGTMAAGSSKTIKINACATGDTGNVNACGAVSYSSSVCAEARIVKPSLKLVKSEPSSALICDMIPVKLVVTNNGTGAASNVVIKDMLPAGMTTSDGKSGTIDFPIGTLAPGASAERTYMMKAGKTGSFTNTAKAMADGGLTADASASTVISQPVLAITKDCPGTVIAAAGRTISYGITVTNTGDAPAAMTMLEDALPAGTSFVSATDGGALQGSTVVWNLGTLAAKASKKVTLVVNPTTQGTITNTATAKATCATPVSASCKTEVRGVPGVLLEVVDDPDPIVAGSTSTYTVRVTNQGQVDITNIKIKLECEDTATIVSNAGATPGNVAGRVINFAPVARLASKGVVTWTVVLKAVKADDHRLAVEMNCDQIQRPVNETESTTFFE
ncbi:MAG: hypothetical protein ACKVZJ_10945 [Phycisphaerales bacterium]